MRNLAYVLCLVFIQSGFAQTLDGYEQRFKIIKNEDSTVRAVGMRLVTKKFSLAPYLEQVKNDVLSEIERLNEQGFTDSELDSFEAELAHNFVQANGFTTDPDAPRISRKAISNLRNVDIEKALRKITDAGVFKELQSKINDALFLLRLDVIANLDDPKYFLKRNVGYTVVTKVLEFAKNRLGSVPLLNLASFIIVRVNDLILEQRLYHQNMLMHYLDGFSEEELGLTHSEVNQIFSSIYESRLSMMEVMTTYKVIAAQWESFGTDRFFTMVRTANKSARVFDKSTSEKISYNFIKLDAERKVILNLTQKAHMFSPKLSLAYDYNKPDKVRRFRSLLNLAQIGIGFLPINGTVKGMVESFVKSFYVEQMRTEGALAAYFESTGDTVMLENFYRQTINPYLIYR